MGYGFFREKIRVVVHKVGVLGLKIYSLTVRLK